MDSNEVLKGHGMSIDGVVHPGCGGMVADLPWLELYPDRKKFLSVIKEECKSEFNSLVSSLCNKYSDLLKSFQGKHAYVDLQIQWHDYITAVAAFVEEQALHDAQMVDLQGHHLLPMLGFLSL